MKKTIYLAPLLLTNFCFSQSISPNVINVSGTTINNSTNVLTFNIGEVAVSKVSSSTNSITQGFLQPELLSSSLDENNFTVSYFPNPTNNVLKIEGLPLNEQYSFEIIDMFGRTVSNLKLLENQILFEDLETGNYQLKIYNKSDELISSQLIIKTNN